MEDSKDNIELRSDKVRSIIGQIPPWIIRSGISVILSVIMILLTGSYFFKYPYLIETTVVFDKKNNYTVGVIKIPANEILKIKKGQDVEIRFENIKNMSNKTFNSKLKYVSKELIISENTGYYLVTVEKIDNLKIVDKSSGIAIIRTEEISFLDRILKPFMTLKNSTK